MSQKPVMTRVPEALDLTYEGPYEEVILHGGPMSGSVAILQTEIIYFESMVAGHDDLVSLYERSRRNEGYLDFVRIIPWVSETYH